MRLLEEALRREFETQGLTASSSPSPSASRSTSRSGSERMTTQNAIPC